jgi:hypothetical protein
MFGSDTSSAPRLVMPIGNGGLRYLNAAHLYLIIVTKKHINLVRKLDLF